MEYRFESNQPSGWDCLRAGVLGASDEYHVRSTEELAEIVGGKPYCLLGGWDAQSLAHGATQPGIGVGVAWPDAFVQTPNYD